MAKIRGKYYICKRCKTIEFIPNGEFGIKTEQIVSVYCPSCACKGHKYKMKEVETK